MWADAEQPGGMTGRSWAAFHGVEATPVRWQQRVLFLWPGWSLTAILSSLVRLCARLADSGRHVVFADDWAAAIVGVPGSLWRPGLRNASNWVIVLTLSLNACDE